MPRKIDLKPFFLGEDWWEGNKHPKRILNQKFATVLGDEDFSLADMHDYRGFKSCPRMPASVKASGASEVKIDEDGFQVTLDIDEFKLEEIRVKVIDGSVEVQGKQVDKRDQYGLVSREFCRRYMVPLNCDARAVTSSLSTDYKLTIKVPVNRMEQLEPMIVVPVVEIEVKPSPMEVRQEEYREVVQKSLENLETFLETPEGGNAELGNSPGTKEGKSLKLMADMVRNTSIMYQVLDGTPPTTPSESEASKLPSESEASKLPSESEASKLPSEPSTM